MEETNPIFSAVKRKASRRELEELVEGGADFRATNELGDSILHVAAMNGNLDAVAYFPSKGVPVDARNDLQMTPLMEAVSRSWKYLPMVDILLENGADINAEDVLGGNAIIIATGSKVPVVELEALMSRGAHWKSSTDSALHAAAKYGYLEGLQFFITKGVDVNVRNESGETPLMRAMFSGGNFAALREALVAAGADWNLKDAEGNSVLHLAAKYCNVDAVKWSISMGFSVNARNERKMTPLLSAAIASVGSQHFVEVVNLLIESGADINAENESRQNIVMLAGMGGRSAMEIDFLVKLGCSLEARDEFGHSVLHMAARFGNLDGLRYLVGRGADVNAVNILGETPLLRAIENWMETWGETLDFLMGKGADVNTVRVDGDNAVFVALKGGKGVEAMRKLVEMGCKWWVSNGKGETIIEKARKSGKSEVLEYFQSIRTGATSD